VIKVWINREGLGWVRHSLYEWLFTKTY